MSYQSVMRRRVGEMVLAAAAIAALPMVSSADTAYYWTGASTTGTGYIDKGGNWMGGTDSPNSGEPPFSGTSDLVFESTNTHNYQPYLEFNYDITELYFETGAVAFALGTFNGSTFNIGSGGVTSTATNAETIAVGVKLTANQIWYSGAVGGVVNDQGALNLNTYGLNVSTQALTAVVNFSGALSGTGTASLSKVGSGAMLLSGGGSIPSLLLNAGNTQISSGTLILTSTGTPFNLNAATLNVSGGAIVDWSGTGAFAAVDGGASASVSGSNSKLKAGFQFDVGSSGQGTLTVTNSGTASSAGYFIVGDAGGSTGVLNISGGTVTAPYGILGNFAGATGTAMVTGSTSQWNLTSYLGIGGNAQTGVAAGTLTVSNNGAVTTPLTTLYYGMSTINVSGGTLTTGGLASFQTGNGSIMLADPSGGTALTINGSSGTSTYTYSGSISGTGSILKSGASTQVLSGNLNTSGTVTVSAGTLKFNGSGTNSISVLSTTGGIANLTAGTLKLTSGDEALSVQGGSLNISGGTLDASSGTQNYIDNASVTVTGSGTLFKGGSELDVGEHSGDTATLTVSSGAQVSVGSLQVPFFGQALLSVVSGGVVNASGVIVGGDPYSTSVLSISGGGAVNVSSNILFEDAVSQLNISGGAVTTGSVSSYATGDGLINLIGNPTSGIALLINGTSGGQNYSGTIFGAGSFQKSGGSTQILSGNINISGNATVTAGTLTFSGSGNSSIGMLSVTGGIANLTAGTLKLTNTSTGLTVTGGSLNVSGGTLDASATAGYNYIDNAIVTVTGAGTQFNAGAFLDVAKNAGYSATLNVSAGALVTAGALFLPNNGNGTLSVSSGGVVNLSQLDFGLPASFLNVSGGGAVNVTGNSYFYDAVSPLNVSGGTFTTGSLHSSDTGDGVINLISNPSGGLALTINDPTATDINTYSGTISGAGSFQKSGGSTQILSGNINTSGFVLVIGGTLNFNASRTSSINSISVEGGAAIVSNGTLRLTNTAFQYLVGSGTLTISNGATVDATALSSSLYSIDGVLGAGMTVTGMGSTYKGGNELTVGLFALGSLSVQSSGLVTNTTYLSIGQSAESIGSLSIASGGMVQCGTGILGMNANATGLATVSGVGSSWNCSSGLYIGGGAGVGGSSNATGMLTINSSGSVVTPFTSLQSNSATINISAGTFTTGYLTSHGTGYGAINLQADPLGATALTINDTTATDVNTYSGTISGAGSFQKSGGSTQVFSGNINMSGSAIVTAGKLTFGGTGSNRIGTLAISTGAILDLTNGSADIGTTALATINPWVKSGYNGGKWNGSGIVSSTAAANSTHLTAIGVIQNNQGGSPLYSSSHPFIGVTPGASDVLLAYTYYGDTNLDGKVDGSDYSRIDNGYLHSSTLTGWFNGDFNYDGVIDGSDYTLIDNAFNTQSAILAVEIASPTSQVAETSSVPEPASMWAISLASIGLLRRRNWLRRFAPVIASNSPGRKAGDRSANSVIRSSIPGLRAWAIKS